MLYKTKKILSRIPFPVACLIAERLSGGIYIIRLNDLISENDIFLELESEVERLYTDDVSALMTADLLCSKYFEVVYAKIFVHDENNLVTKIIILGGTKNAFNGS